MTNVMHWPITACALEWRIISRRQPRTPWEDHVKDDLPAMIGFTPNAEVLIKLIAQFFGRDIGTNRQPIALAERI